MNRNRLCEYEYPEIDLEDRFFNTNEDEEDEEDEDEAS